MEHLKLLERHRQKVAFWHALMKLIFIYACILIFQSTSLYFREKNEENLLMSKFEKVKVLIQTKNIISHDISTLPEDIKKTLEDTYIYDNTGKKLNHINDSLSQINIPSGNIIDTLGYKYYSGEVISENGLSYVLVRSSSENLLLEFFFMLLIIGISAPFLYVFLAYISCRAMHKIYAPIRESIENLENFSTDINHEFKNTLSEILSSLELGVITGEYEENSKKAIRSTKKLNSTLDSLSSTLYFTNSEYRKEKVDVIMYLDEILEDHRIEAERKHITLQKKYNLKKTMKLQLDKKALLLCFSNILRNAVRYSHSEGKIEIDIFQNGFSIKDYGVGIDPENIEKIFERNFRESYHGEGSGIGLSLVKKILHIYSWKIEVYSEKGAYTEVRLHFS